MNTAPTDPAAVMYLHCWVYLERPGSGRDVLLAVCLSGLDAAALAEKVSHYYRGPLRVDDKMTGRSSWFQRGVSIEPQEPQPA